MTVTRIALPSLLSHGNSRPQIASIADQVLTVDVDGPSPYDSMVSLVALIEALVAGLVERLGESGRQRVSALERLRSGRTWDDREIAV